MRNSDLFVLAAKMAVITGFDYKNSKEITAHERDAIDTGLRELEFYSPGFKDKYKSMETRPVGKPAGAAQRK